jgi:hypothetical protein
LPSCKEQIDPSLLVFINPLLFALYQSIPFSWSMLTVFFHFSSVSNQEDVIPSSSRERQIISSPINLSCTFISICSLGSSSVSFAQSHIHESISILSRNVIESSLSFSVMVMKISGFSPSSTTFFLRRSSRCVLAISMSDNT